MKSFLSPRVCVAVLLGFLLSFATGSFSPKWISHHLAHELEEIAMGVVPLDHDGHAHEAAGGEGEAEHSTLHATVQLVSMPCADFRLHEACRAGIIRSHLTAAPFSVAASGAPFRPPRA